MDYRYTIRGQLASINNSTLANDDSNDDSNDVFGMNLLYEGSDSGVGNTGKYNGLVTAVKWKVNASGVVSTTNERSYKFSYDKLMRLNAANYADRSGSGSWGNTGAYDEKGITYDLNGNIMTLQRRAVISGSATDVDNLSYSYDGNRLDNVTDGSGGSYALFGFKNLTSSGSAYVYDVNGNLKSDTKKGLDFDYNVLNRTERIVINATGSHIDYTYSSDGSLIRKKTYAGGVVQKTTDYIGGFTYEDGTLAYFGMAEGRVRNASGTLTNEYIIRDLQGNARVSFEDNAGTAVVRQENSYYPFGLSMPGNTIPSAANKMLYNGGSEWQDDFADLPDLQQTFYRNYDPALGRFVAVDPVAESAESMTTYQYAMNSPVMFNDPMGDQASGGATGYDYGWNTYRTGSGSGNNWSDFNDHSDPGKPVTPGQYWDSWGDILVGAMPLLKSDYGGYWSGVAGDFNAFQNSYEKKAYEKYMAGDGPNGFWRFESRNANLKGEAGVIGENVFHSFKSQPGKTKHETELEKYGQINAVTVTSVSASLVGGVTLEFGHVGTDKNYVQYYYTKYYSHGFSPPSFSAGFAAILPGKGKHPTFSDFRGAYGGIAGSIGFLTANVGFSTNYTAIGAGFTVGKSFSFMKENKYSGTFSLGTTTLIGQPMLMETDISEAYTRRLMYNGGQ